MRPATNDNAALNSLDDARRLGVFLVEQFGSGAQAKADRLLRALSLLAPMREEFRQELFDSIVRLEMGHA